MRRQVLFVGLICVAFLVNAQEEKTIDLDEVTIQASSIIRKKRPSTYIPLQRPSAALDGWLGFDKADVFTSPMGRSEYEKYLYGEWKRSVAYKWRVGFFLRSRRPLAGGYQTGGISR